ncbi:MAG: hypothetical protein ACRDJH_21285 [Thermomicrobiales bacterium]
MDRDNQSIDDSQPIDGDAPQQQRIIDASPRVSDILTLETSTIAIWLAIVVALVGFLLLGRVTVHADGFERTMRVADVWTGMTDDLPDVSRQIFLKVLYVVAIAATLIGSFVAILIALAARSPEAATTRTPSALRDGKTVLDAPESSD